MWETKAQPMISLKDCGQTSKDALLQDFFRSDRSENTFSETEEGRTKMSLHHTDYTTQLHEGQL